MSQENIDEKISTDTGFVNIALGIDAQLGRKMDLSDEFCLQVIKQVGNYKDVYNRTIGATMIYVTHDQTEAMTLADRIVARGFRCDCHRDARRCGQQPSHRVCNWVLVDANQNWTVTEAIEAMAQLSDYSIDFLEEPLRADTPLSDWAMLANATDVPLAARENITSQDQFSAFMDDGLLRVVQPDVAKWGGICGAMEVGQPAAERDLMCALHYMGSGVGLAASLHALAAIGGSGSVELDANPNPLRTDLGEIDLAIKSGMLQVPPDPGHGFIPDTAALKSRSVARFEAT